jgi:hypothetical protein
MVLPPTCGVNNLLLSATRRGVRLWPESQGGTAERGAEGSVGVLVVVLGAKGSAKTAKGDSTVSRIRLQSLSHCGGV